MGSPNVDEGLCEMLCEGGSAATQIHKHSAYLILGVLEHLVEVNLHLDRDRVCILARHSVLESPYFLFMCDKLYT